MHKQLPKFDPDYSGNFAAEILEKLKIEGILIGRLAVWAWLPQNSAKQAYTKDLDIAVSKTSLFVIRDYLKDQHFNIKQLEIGGVNVKDGKHINVDFIDRSSIEWSDYSVLFEQAINEAIRSNRMIEVGNKTLFLVSIEYLITMKLATGEKKDEEDIKVLLLETDNIDFKEVRSLIYNHLGSLGRNRFEIILRDIHHKESRLTSYQGIETSE
ncbi:MAG: hypothetical protein HQK77_17915 [Desulfobacterales bacterium]|nr:hypothetical protein [Desulfobacterales bacterium]